MKFASLCWIAICLIAVRSTALAESKPFVRYRGLDSMPVNTIVIQDMGGGLINVKARCVPAETYAAELAKYLGKPVVFSVPVKSRLTVWLSDDKRKPESWLERGMESACCTVKDTGNELQVVPFGLGVNYDPSLDIDTAQPAPVTLDGVKKVTEGIPTGLYFKNGILIPPAYLVELGYLPNGVSLLLNGVEVSKYGMLEKLEAVPDPAREKPAAVTVAELQRNCDTMCRDAAAKGTRWPTARLRVLIYLSQHPFVTVVDPVDSRIGILDKQFGVNTFALAPDTIRLFDSPARPPIGVDPVEQAYNGKLVLERELQRHSVIINSGGIVSFNGTDSVGKMRDALSGAFGDSNAVAECILWELILDREMAREVILNTAPVRKEVVALLSGILERVGPKTRDKVTGHSPTEKID